MVEDRVGDLDAVFKALGHPTRRSMIERLSAGATSIGELAAPLAMSFEAASKHVRVLEAAGLLRREIRGRTHVCALRGEPLGSASAWLATYRDFWAARLDALADLVEGDAP